MSSVMHQIGPVPTIRAGTVAEVEEDAQSLVIWLCRKHLWDQLDRKQEWELENKARHCLHELVVMSVYLPEAGPIPFMPDKNYGATLPTIINYVKWIRRWAELTKMGPSHAQVISVAEKILGLF